MHIPGGLVSDPVCVTDHGGFELRAGARFLDEPAEGTLASAANRWPRSVPLVFAAQMVNFPVDHGTSGHLIGGALAAALLGPWGAMWAMASVVTIQALRIWRWRLGALGANLLTMAVTAPWTAWLAYRGLARVRADRSRFVIDRV